MTGKLNNPILPGKKNQKKKPLFYEQAQSFMPSAVRFYLLSITLALTIFILVLLIFDDSGADASLIPAFIFAGMILGGAIVLREIVLRNRRNKLLLAQERLDLNLKNVARRVSTESGKLTLEKNAAILYQISQKSEAANVLEKVPEAHWEVFELCDEYLHRSEKELESVQVGSPRLLALKRGREQIRTLHKFHLLAYSAAESRTLIQEAGASDTISDKIEIAARALNILDSAIEFYPDEQQLIESANAVNEFITSVKVSDWIKQAENAVLDGNKNDALNYYRDALFYLARDNVRSDERDAIAEKINREVEKLKNS